MNGQRGYTLIELLIASAILLMVSGAVLGLLHDGLVAAPVLEGGLVVRLKGLKMAL